jgi:hypothetical protein
MHPLRWHVCVFCTLIGTATCLGDDVEVYVKAIDFNGNKVHENIQASILGLDEHHRLAPFPAKVKFDPKGPDQPFFSIDVLDDHVRVETASRPIDLEVRTGGLYFEIGPSDPKRSLLVGRRCTGVDPHSLKEDKLLTVPMWTKNDIEHLADFILKNPDHLAIAIGYRSADGRYDIVAMAESDTGGSWLDDVAPRLPRIVWPGLVQQLSQTFAAGMTLPISYNPDLDRARTLASEQRRTVYSNPIAVPNYVPVDVPVRREVPVYVRREVPVNVFVRRPVPVDIPVPRYRYYDVWVPRPCGEGYGSGSSSAPAMRRPYFDVVGPGVVKR